MKGTRLFSVILSPALAVLLLVVTAHAHVKWFVDFDVAKPPRSIGEVLDGTFIKMFLTCAALVYVFFLIDRYIYKSGRFTGLDERLRSLDGFGEKVMRICAGVFFVSLWAWYLLYGTTFYLTPELATAAAYVPWIHLVLGLAMLSRYTTPIAGPGIFVLWAMAAADFGIFHMLDYLIFLGIGYFFISLGTQSPGWMRSGFIVLFACAGLTLIWASVEKFGYAEWTFPLLEQNPEMLMGLDPRTYMTLSGFVEFGVTFVLLGAVSIIGRFVALGMMSIFVLAVYKFGMVDALGHLMIVAILVVLVVRGPTDARNMLLLTDKNVFTEAYFMTGLYFLAFVMAFILYYGLHYLVFDV